MLSELRLLTDLLNSILTGRRWRLVMSERLVVREAHLAHCLIHHYTTIQFSSKINDLKIFPIDNEQ